MGNDLDIMSNIESDATSDPISDILNSVNTHLKRVLVLFDFIPRLMIPPPQSEGEKKKAEIAFTEILRSEVVLIHAILEDSLREILRFKLKNEISPELLTVIPLVGISQGGQPKKFGLEDLAKHRGETVDRLIELSIDNYLDKTSFSSSQSIASVFQKSGIDIKTLNKYFPSLDKMIIRRHQIVHRADRIGDVGKWQIPKVNPGDIYGWMMTVFFFVTDVSFLVKTPDETAEFQEAINNDETIKELRAYLQQYLDKGVEGLELSESQKTTLEQYLDQGAEGLDASK